MASTGHYNCESISNVERKLPQAYWKIGEKITLKPFKYQLYLRLHYIIVLCLWQLLLFHEMEPFTDTHPKSKLKDFQKCPCNWLEPVLQIRGKRDNLGIIFHITPLKPML